MGMRTAERLREVAEGMSTLLTVENPIDSLRVSVDAEESGTYSNDMRNALIKIAELMDTEIEERYLPRPVFEDGEVVRSGDAIDHDGVRLEVTGTMVKVIGATDDKPVEKVYSLCGSGLEGYVASPLPRWKEPDSLERIEKDARMHYRDYWGCDRVECDDCPAKVDGKVPLKRYGVDLCLRAQTLDLLRRQRILLEK